MAYLWVALGSAFGGIARYWCSNNVTVGSSFPFSTLLVNVLGSFVIGLCAALTGPGGKFLVHPDIRLFIMVGLYGGYTTFSAFSIQTFDLIHEGKLFYAGMNIILSVVLCIAAVGLGYMTASKI